ncbi:hypothetical protein DFH29DRAFT_1035541 [Suillus ampliporus]|nr:hypothetical protein DFH29DRAFT_1035541 [Suillus ampliporus]
MTYSFEYKSVQKAQELVAGLPAQAMDSLHRVPFGRRISFLEGKPHVDSCSSDADPSSAPIDPAHWMAESVYLQFHALGSLASSFPIPALAVAEEAWTDSCCGTELAELGKARVLPRQNKAELRTTATNEVDIAEASSEVGVTMRESLVLLMGKLRAASHSSGGQSDYSVLDVSARGIVAREHTQSHYHNKCAVNIVFLRL